MIVVLADDFTGAAEVAATARWHNLSAEVQTQFHADVHSDVVILDTDSRSLNPADAVERLSELTQLISTWKPDWVFKKVDSVLRGPVAAEVSAIVKAGNWRDAVLVPANPDGGRCVVNGRYRVHGVPLHETAFVADPEHPATTDDVNELLRVRNGGRLTSSIEVRDTAGVADLRAIAERLAADELPAGSSAFFAACLQTRFGHRPRTDPDPIEPRFPTLLVRGSAFPAAFLGEFPVHRFTGESIHLEDWINDIVDDLRSGTAAIELAPTDRTRSPRDWLESLADVVTMVLGRTAARRLMLDGGSTAAAVLHRLNWTRFHAGACVSAAAVVLQPVGFNDGEVIVKPGSYRWPTSIFSHARTD